MSTARQYRFWLAGLLLALVVLYLLRAVLLPFVAGLALAYFLDPLCDRLEKWGCGRALATTIVLIGFGVFVAVVLLLLIPLIQSQIVGLVASLPALAAALVAHLEPLLQLADEHLSPQEMADLKSALSSQAGSVVQWIGGALGAMLSGGLALVNILSLIFITPVVTFYMLRDWDRLVVRIDACLPRDGQGGAAMVSRDHDHADPGAAALRHRLGNLRAQRIGECHESQPAELEPARIVRQRRVLRTGLGDREQAQAALRGGGHLLLRLRRHARAA